MLIIPAKIIATCFALVAFVAALFVGVTIGNTLDTVLFKAIVAMFICWIVGYLAGSIAQKVIDQNIARYKASHPIVDDADGVAQTPETQAELAQTPAQADISARTAG